MFNHSPVTFTIRHDPSGEWCSVGCRDAARGRLVPVSNWEPGWMEHATAIAVAVLGDVKPGAPLMRRDWVVWGQP